jgi:hypothetical protein
LERKSGGHVVHVSCLVHKSRVLSVLPGVLRGEALIIEVIRDLGISLEEPRITQEVIASPIFFVNQVLSNLCCSPCLSILCNGNSIAIRRVSNPSSLINEVIILSLLPSIFTVETMITPIVWVSLLEKGSRVLLFQFYAVDSFDAKQKLYR